MAKARLLIKGNIQGVGYRALLTHTAKRSAIQGLTRNLKDGNVEVFCKGTTKNIQKFIKAIQIKGPPEDIFTLHVEAIQCFWEGEEGYREAWKPYKDFEIDYGVRMSQYQYLAMEDREYRKLYLSNLMRTGKETQQEVRNLTVAEKETRDEIRNLTVVKRETKAEIHNRFEEMKNRYDKTSRKTPVLEDVPKELQLLRKSVDRFLAVLLQGKEAGD